eukprot:TRINITY_DN9249_c0_g1_i15.p5 TRINITY_DN9249_c0_g1~~TRINITY_DN9249_c0_g1_i15.p5  ORF type:complete len:110 (+),score=17.85 TRINITY_DN9249_c0_g1_i15:877-1206(+)
MCFFVATQISRQNVYNFGVAKYKFLKQQQQKQQFRFEKKKKKKKQKKKKKKKQKKKKKKKDVGDKQTDTDVMNANKCPHLYGLINFESVTNEFPVLRGEDGEFLDVGFN